MLLSFALWRSFLKLKSFFQFDFFTGRPSSPASSSGKSSTNLSLGSGITLSASLLASKYNDYSSMKSLLDTKKEIGMMSWKHLAFQIKTENLHLQPWRRKRLFLNLYLFFYSRFLEALIMYIIVKLDFVLIRTTCFGKQL